ncbi:chymotrypsin B-like [Rhopilema esculentum]|uniref:chymotrypsin B-like n=1 Tax=Rhopilema esculentum TaxID=499914 RepID=UPI0031D4BDB6
MHFGGVLNTMDKRDFATLLFILSLSLGAVSRSVWKSGVLKKSRDKRMINGEKADLRNWPFIASLKYTQSANVYWKICSATAISKRWMVTVAHCVRDKKGGVIRPNDLKVELRDKTDPYKSSTFSTEKILVHPRIGDAISIPLDSEIALIKLEGNASFHTTPIKLNSGSDFHRNCKSAGWGSQEVLPRGTEDILQKNYSISSTLQEIEVPLNVTWRHCLLSSRIKHAYSPGHYHKVFCGGEKTNNTEMAQGGCIGDSGSPLVCEGSNGVALFGLMIGGDKRCIPGGSYMGFADIAKHHMWLISSIKG